MLNRRVDRLLAAGEWRDPAAALGLADWEDVFYPELIRIAGARAARNGRCGALPAVRERLLLAEAREIEPSLEAFASRLAAASPEGAERALARARRLYEAGREAS